MPAVAAAKSAPLVLIHGDDDLGVAQRAREIYQQWCAELGGMDHEIIDAGAANSGEALRSIGKLREALQTLPFFGSGKAVWFKGCNFLADDRTSSATAVTEAMIELAQELKEFSWDSVRLLISAAKVDKRKTFYKTIEKAGTTETFAAWSTEDKDWALRSEEAALKQLRAMKKDIDDQALARLVACVGANARQLANEVEKLSLFVGDRAEITTADVDAVVTRNKQARAFALADALGERDLPRVLRCLDEELWEVKLDNQRSEIGLLYGLISKVRAMLFGREMQRLGWIKGEFGNGDYSRFKSQLERVPADQLPADKKFNPLSMNPYVLFKAFQHARQYSAAELVRAMELLLRGNVQLVTSGLDEGMVLQQTLVRIVQRADAAPVPARAR
jgi:DNA polymerase-3 subunit delta